MQPLTDRVDFLEAIGISNSDHARKLTRQMAGLIVQVVQLQPSLSFRDLLDRTIKEQSNETPHTLEVLECSFGMLTRLFDGMLDRLID